jgi:hypothetical protein
MLIDDLIAQLRELPEGSRVVEVSGWAEEPPEFPVPRRYIARGRGLVIRIDLPGEVVEIGPNGWPARKELREFESVGGVEGHASGQRTAEIGSDSGCRVPHDRASS